MTAIAQMTLSLFRAGGVPVPIYIRNGTKEVLHIKNTGQRRVDIITQSNGDRDRQSKALESGQERHICNVDSVSVCCIYNDMSKIRYSIHV